MLLTLMSLSRKHSLVGMLSKRDLAEVLPDGYLPRGWQRASWISIVQFLDRLNETAKEEISVLVNEKKQEKQELQRC